MNIKPNKIVLKMLGITVPAMRFHDFLFQVFGAICVEK